MSINWTLLVDIFISLFIILFLIGQRFNEWPKTTKPRPKLSGKPIDYINPFRYYTFFFVYISTFLVVGLAADNLGLAVHEYIFIPNDMKNLLSILGDQSYTIYALFLWALVNLKFIKEWDDRWRNRLQDAARIPKAVLDMKQKILVHDNEITPRKDQLKELIAEMRKNGVGDYWEPYIDNCLEEQEQSSLEWHFLKTKYIHQACKMMRVNMLFDKKADNQGAENQDVENYEKRLKELAYMISTPGRHMEETKQYMDEIITMYTYLVECLCKHVIRKYTSKRVQLKALEYIGFNIN